MTQNKYRVLDLFSGAGGLSRGFLDAGFDVVLGVDNDKRNMLFTAMVELAKLIKPKFVVLENVMGMLKLYDGKGARRVIKGFENAGYTMKAQEMYAPDFGIPQMRRRIFFVGVLDSNTNFEFPAPTHDEQTYITCEQAINDLPSLENGVWSEVQDYPCEPKTEYQEKMRNGSQKIINHIGSRHTEKTLNLISMIPAGKNHKCLPTDLK